MISSTNKNGEIVRTTRVLYGSDVRPRCVLCGLLLCIASLWIRCSPPARLMVPSVAHICSMDPMLTSAASYGAFCCAQLLLRTRSGMSRRTRMMAGRRTRRRRRRKKGISSKSPPAVTRLTVYRRLQVCSLLQKVIRIGRPWSRDDYGTIREIGAVFFLF